MPKDTYELYSGNALQYYIVGRFAVFTNLRVAGNLLHHAVEMALKGHLSRSLSPANLKKLKHSLGKLWPSFKESVSTSGLEKHDTVISRLIPFETVRYPDHAAEHGARFLISPGVAPKSHSKRLREKLPRSVPRYDIYLGDVDALLAAIFAAASINPKFFSQGLKEAALDYLTTDNPTDFWGSPRSVRTLASEVD